VVRSAEVVEDVQLCRGEGQLAMLMLAVERHEGPAEVAELTDGGRTPVQIGARPTVGADPAGEHHLGGIGRQAIGDLCRNLCGQVKHTLNVRLGGSGTHYSGPRPPAQQKVEGVGEYRLPGARLAGEDVQPGGQAQLGPLNQQEVLDAKFTQHERRSSSARRRIIERGDILCPEPLGGSFAVVRPRDWTGMTIGDILSGYGLGMDLSEGPERPYTRPPNGMAANDPPSHSRPLSPGHVGCLSAEALGERMDEEINRAGRHDSPLSCLLVVIDNIAEFSGEQGSDLPEQVFAYLARALGRELRRFDRIGRPTEDELLLLLPGADGPRGEIVARRVLDRMRTIKVEAAGTRRPLRVSVGLAAWQKDTSGEDLLARTRAAARRAQAEDAATELAGAAPVQSSSPPALGRPGPS
jgi:diguanylate cyclase (GGDEF)-like protein